MFLCLRWLIIILAFYVQSGYALGTDRKEKMLLTANTAQLNLETGIGTYSGNVKLEQGSSHLEADKLITRTDKKNQLQQAIAFGKPAKYRTLPQLDKPEFYAEAESIEYYPHKNLLILIGHAKAHQKNNVYSGPRIEYDMKREIVFSPASTQGRTTIILQQKNNE